MGAVPPFVVIVVAALILIYAVQAAGQTQGDTVTGLVSNPTSGVNRLGAAIQVAEGSNAIYNNPGDLVIPGWTGQTFGAGIAVFPTAQEGWERLWFELTLIVQGRSKVYSLSDTIATMAAKWTQTDQTAWAQNVADSLGVSVDTPLSQILP